MTVPRFDIHTDHFHPSSETMLPADLHTSSSFYVTWFFYYVNWALWTPDIPLALPFTASNLSTTRYILRVLLVYQNFVFLKSACLILDYLIHDAEDNGVDKAYSSHSHQAQQEEVGITVQLEVGGLWVKDGAH